MNEDREALVERVLELTGASQAFLEWVCSKYDGPSRAVEGRLLSGSD